MAGTLQPVRVVRTWPGGPPLGQVITPPATRREVLLQQRVVEPVEQDTAAARPPRKRGTPRAPVTGEADLLGRAATR